MLSYISYKQDGVFQGILVEAPTVEAAKRFFLSEKPFSEVLGVREAFAGDQKPGIPVLTVSEREEAAFFKLDDIIRDAERRKGGPGDGGPGDPPGGAGALEPPKKEKDEILDVRKTTPPTPVYVPER